MENNNFLLRKRTNLPKEVLIYHLIAVVAGFFIFNIMVFFQGLDPSTAGSLFVVTSAVLFFVLFIFNNKTAEAIEDQMNTLTASKNITGIEVFNQFSEYLCGRLAERGLSYTGVLSRDAIIKTNFDSIFDPVFLEDAAEVKMQFTKVNGNLMFFFNNLSLSQREQMIRYFTLA